MADEQQQQQQQQKPASIDYSAVYGTLSPENKETFERKGFHKAGANGGPADINAVIDWARSSEKLIGGDKLPAPRLDNDEEFGKWPGWDKLGVPKDAKDYKFERPQLPEGVQYDEAAEATLRAALHKGRVGQKQATEIYNEMFAFRAGEATKAIEAVSNAQKAMDTELRQAFGTGYDAEIARGQMALRYAAEKAGLIAAGDDKDAIAKKLGGAADAMAKAFGDAGAVKVFVWLGKQLGEDTIKGGHAAGFAASARGARSEIETLKLDAEFQKAYGDKRHPGHQAAVDRMARLFETATNV